MLRHVGKQSGECARGVSAEEENGGYGGKEGYDVNTSCDYVLLAERG